MKISPNQDPEERAEEAKTAGDSTILFAVLLAVSCSVFLWGAAEFPPAGDGT